MAKSGVVLALAVVLALCGAVDAFFVGAPGPGTVTRMASGSANSACSVSAIFCALCCVVRFLLAVMLLLLLVAVERFVCLRVVVFLHVSDCGKLPSQGTLLVKSCCLDHVVQQQRTAGNFHVMFTSCELSCAFERADALGCFCPGVCV